MIVVVEGISASGKSTGVRGMAVRMSFRRTVDLPKPAIAPPILQAQQRSGRSAISIDRGPPWRSRMRWATP